jgi:CheY-like chemotaxis protein
MNDLIQEPRASKGAPARGARDAEVPGGTERILLVEDEDVVREVLVQVLRRYGYRVVDAPDATRALETSAVEDEPFDLLVTDVVMPGLNGPRLAERLRAERPELPVLYISGYPGDELVAQGMLDVDRPFLQKPFSPAVLARKVRELLETTTASGTAE